MGLYMSMKGVQMKYKCYCLIASKVWVIKNKILFLINDGNIAHTFVSKTGFTIILSYLNTK